MPKKSEKTNDILEKNPELAGRADGQADGQTDGQTTAIL